MVYESWQAQAEDSARNSDELKDDGDHNKRLESCCYVHRRFVKSTSWAALCGEVLTVRESTAVIVLSHVLVGRVLPVVEAQEEAGPRDSTECTVLLVLLCLCLRLILISSGVASVCHNFIFLKIFKT